MSTLCCSWTHCLCCVGHSMHSGVYMCAVCCYNMFPMSILCWDTVWTQMSILCWDTVCVYVVLSVLCRLGCLCCVRSYKRICLTACPNSMPSSFRIPSRPVELERPSAEIHREADSQWSAEYARSIVSVVQSAGVTDGNEEWQQCWLKINWGGW